MENKISKYLLYAIGEIILVVIGILIALQISNWNEERKNRQFEKETLAQISANLVKDRLTLSNIARNFNKAVESTDKILQQNINQSGADSIKYWFANVAQFDRFQPLTNAYEVVKSKGLDLISNKELRFMLGRYYDDEAQEAIKSIADIEYSFNEDWSPLLKQEALDMKWKTYIELRNYDLFEENSTARTTLKLMAGNYSSGVEKIYAAIAALDEIQSLINMELNTI